jgi:hypothetical protein
MTQLPRESEWLSRNATFSFAFSREQILLKKSKGGQLDEAKAERHPLVGHYRLTDER